MNMRNYLKVKELDLMKKDKTPIKSLQRDILPLNFGAPKGEA